MKVSYQNMKAELKRVGASYEDVSALLGMSMNNFSLKINGRIPMTVEEAKAIQATFCRDATLDYLLANGLD